MGMNNTVRNLFFFSIFLFALVACGPKRQTESVETYFTAIDKYLTEQIGSLYSQGEICIPFHDYVAVDESNSEDILVWGDFWVFNYDRTGDTLKTVSGGNHPGLMHVRQTGGTHFEVTSFDQVADGSDNEPSAKKIFGEKYSDYVAACADDAKREKVRTEAISDYITSHDIPVTMYKDYGWPEVVIPKN